MTHSFLLSSVTTALSALKTTSKSEINSLLEKILCSVQFSSHKIQSSIKPKCFENPLHTDSTVLNMKETSDDHENEKGTRKNQEHVWKEWKHSIVEIRLFQETENIERCMPILFLVDCIVNYAHANQSTVLHFSRFELMMLLNHIRTITDHPSRGKHLQALEKKWQEVPDDFNLQNMKTINTYAILVEGMPPKPCCYSCSESFEIKYNDEDESWFLYDAVLHYNSILYHSGCMNSKMNLNL